MARDSLKSVMRLVEASQKTVPAEQDFLNDLIRSIELTDAKNRRKGSASYKPSSMHCIRQMYYIRTGMEPEEGGSSYSMVGICNSGTDIHQRIQQAVLDMASNGIDCEYVNVADYVRSRELSYLDIVKEPDFEHGDYETKLYHKDLNLSFLCDGIIRYKGKYYILELKTESANKFWQRDGVDVNHYNQGTCYSLSFGIDEVLFVYISRDTFGMKSFIFKPTDDMKYNIVGLIENCEGYVKRQTAPPKPKDVERKTCEWCAFKTQCRKDG